MGSAASLPAGVRIPAADKNGVRAEILHLRNFLPDFGEEAGHEDQKMVRGIGFEPTTSTMSRCCSTTELTARRWVL